MDRPRRAGEHPVAYGADTGRFTGERAAFWAEQYQADPEGTTQLIEAMAAVLPTQDDEFAHLFRPTGGEPAVVAAAADARQAEVLAMSDDELRAELFGPEAPGV